MRKFLSLADLDDAAVTRLLALASELQKNPVRTTLAGRVLGLVFMNPSVRTLASFQAGMAQLGGSSFVISPGQGSWGFETRTGATMDGAEAEHVTEAIPVLAGYADVLGLRSFAAGQDLAHDLSDPVLSAVDAVCTKPLINLESAIQHPCQALADHKTLADLNVPGPGGKFVLSWAYHPKPLPLAVPNSTLQMAARRGMDVTVLRPDGFGLPEEVMGQARAWAESKGGSVNETDKPQDAMRGAHVVYAKSWQSTAHYGQAEEESILRATLQDWCIRETYFESADPACKFMHCLPVRRNVVVADEVLDSHRSVVQTQANNRLHVQKAILLELLQ